MGRTNPTFRDVLRGIRKRWRPFRRGLRREEQAVFDDLLEKAGAHADAASYANPTDPVTLVLLSICLEQQAEIAALEDRSAALAERLDAIETDARLGGTETEARLAGLARRLDDLVAAADAETARMDAEATRTDAEATRTDAEWVENGSTDDRSAGGRPADDHLLPDGGDGARPDSRDGTDRNATDRGVADPGDPPVETLAAAIDEFCR